MGKKIFITGATGYIGGSVLYGLLQRQDISEYEITVLTRSKEKGAGFEDLGLKTVLGSIDDYDLITEEAKKADIVVQCADCDEYAFGRALIKGMKAHKDSTGEVPILIHTSGTGVLVVDAKGRAPTKDDPVYDDGDAEGMAKLPDSAPHREGDLAFVEADKRGDLKVYFILPSTIYGEAPGGLGKGKWAGQLHNRRSKQMPLAIQLALKRGQPGVYGEGKNIWPHVNIHDLLDLYNLLFEVAKDGKGDHGVNGYYIAENGHYEYRQVASHIGQAMKKRNLGKSAEPSAYGPELREAVGDMEWYIGSTGQAKSSHSRSLGWKPSHTTDDFYAALDEELEAQLSGKNSISRP